jgi:hypothetical protein
MPCSRRLPHCRHWGGGAGFFLRADAQVASQVRLLSAPSARPAACAACPIRVCTKKACWNNGGKELWRPWSRSWKPMGIRQAVELKGVSCLGNCKRGPNVESPLPLPALPPGRSLSRRRSGRSARLCTGVTPLTESPSNRALKSRLVSAPPAGSRMNPLPVSCSPETLGVAEIFHGSKDRLHLGQQFLIDGSAAHFAQLRIFTGFALPAIVVVMSGFAIENCRPASRYPNPGWSTVPPPDAQRPLPLRAPSATGGAAHSSVPRAERPAFMIPTPRSLSSGTSSSQSGYFAACIDCS